MEQPKKILVTMEVKAIDGRGYSYHPDTLRHILYTILKDADEETPGYWDYSFKVKSVNLITSSVSRDLVDDVFDNLRERLNGSR